MGATEEKLKVYGDGTVPAGLVGAALGGAGSAMIRDQYLVNMFDLMCNVDRPPGNM